MEAPPNPESRTQSSRGADHDGGDHVRTPTRFAMTNTLVLDAPERLVYFAVNIGAGSVRYPAASGGRVHPAVTARAGAKKQMRCRLA